jgi:hypothetical protein
MDPEGFDFINGLITGWIHDLLALLRSGEK